MSDSPHSPKSHRIPSPSLLLEAAFQVARYRIALSWLPFDRVRRWAEAGASRKAAGGTAAVCRAVDLADRRLLPGRHCLSAALAAMTMLGRRGIRTTLQIGVRPADPGSIHAHAWLEHEGQVILGDGELETFRPLPPLPDLP